MSPFLPIPFGSASRRDGRIGPEQDRSCSLGRPCEDMAPRGEVVAIARHAALCVDGQSVDWWVSPAGTPLGNFLQESANTNLQTGHAGLAAQIAVCDHAAVDDRWARRVRDAERAMVFEKSVREHY